MVSKSIKFLCYTDIHHDEYHNGLTGDDIGAVEDECYELIVKHNVDFWLFGGDRFLSRNPYDITKQRADRALKKKNDLAKLGYLMVGNHDQYTKSPYSAHTMGHISLYSQDLSNLTVMDKRTVYPLVVRGASVAIHAVPAGQLIEQDPFVFDPTVDFNICLFHAIIRGCQYQNGMPAEDGLSFSLFNRKEFDIVLGGDNHKPQEIKGLTDTKGVYIGAPCQHNWGDVGDKRGFLLVELIKDQDGLHRNLQFIESSSPKFLKPEIKIASLDDFIDIINTSGLEWKNNIVRILVTGPNDVLDSIAVSTWEDKIKNQTKARSIKVQLQFDIQQMVPTATDKPRSDAEAWHDFLATQTGVLAGQDILEIERIGAEFIQNA